MTMRRDPIVEEVHEIREELLREYGGFEGYARHLQELQKELGTRIVRRPRRKPAKQKVS